MNKMQAGILAPVPKQARHMMFTLKSGADVKTALVALAAQVNGEDIVAGIGRSSILAMGREVPGLKTFPVFDQARVELPATPYALWCWLRGEDRGELFLRSLRLNACLAGAYQAEFVMDSFQFGQSQDLTGFEDGTENPSGDEALAAAFVQDPSPGLEGSSYVAVQQWLHDLDTFGAMSRDRQDNTFGRRLSDNQELDDAPPTAHVKRTAQEDFDPPAFILRRSMPWAHALRAGLMFVAFGNSFTAFEALLERMSGAEDGQLDALFRFTRPVTGSYFWCPPMAHGKLDLSALDI